MKVMAINGSPRKKGWNTVTLLQNALQGARSTGADTELVQLYDLKFSGCISCFSCKKIGREQDGVCAVKDGLAPVLAAIREGCDALIIGTPVYYGCETAATRAFLERLAYPIFRHDPEAAYLSPRPIKTGLIYTTNAPGEDMEPGGYNRHFERMRAIVERHFGSCELLVVPDTMQHRDFSKYDPYRFDPEHKRRHHQEVFPRQCRRAREMGARLAS